MRRFALGVLQLTPERFGAMILGDFLDAVGGYNEAETERMKSTAEIVRTATWFLWNTQVLENDRKMTPEAFWKFPWDKGQEPIEISDEKYEALVEEQKRIISGM